MKGILFIGCFSMLFPMVSPAQNNLKELDLFLSTLYRNHQFNGNVLVAEEGRVVYNKSFGLADFQQQIPIKKNTAFPIASITKSFTATAILQLQEQGKLNIQDAVSKYLTGFPYSDITIQHLLTHSSGLQPYDRFFENIRKAKPDTVFYNRDILPQYANLKLPLLYKPGENVRYDNVNFIFLALIIEKVTGMQYPDYITRYILQPAGMNATSFPKFTFYHFTPAEKKNMVNVYRYPHLYSDNFEKADTAAFITSYWHTYIFNGFGEMISTTDDLLKYDQALYSGKLLNAASLKRAFTPFRLNSGELNPGNQNGNSFGLGWIIETDSSFGKIVRGSGGMIGLRASFIRNISRHQTIILVDNTQNETDNIGKTILKIINGQTVPAWRKSLAREYGKALAIKGPDATDSTFKKLQKDSLHYYCNENELNNLGYDLMSSGKLKEALVCFELNTRLFPDSWNVYDSYGEALLNDGRKEEAIKMYKRSVEINPANDGGKQVLEKILQK